MARGRVAAVIRALAFLPLLLSCACSLSAIRLRPHPVGHLLTCVAFVLVGVSVGVVIAASVLDCKP